MRDWIGRAAALLLLTLAVPGLSAGQTVDLPETVPDWADQRELFGSIVQPGREADDNVIDWVVRHQQALAPGYLLWLADRLVERDPDRALDWLALGSLRLTYDERRCGGPKEMSPLMEIITIVSYDTWGYAQGHPGDAAKAFSRVLDRPDLFQPPAASLPPCSVWGQDLVALPQSDWPALQQRVRDEFTGTVGQLTARQAALDRILSSLRIEVSNADASCPGNLPHSVTVTNGDASALSEMEIMLLARRAGEDRDATNQIFKLEQPLPSGDRWHHCFRNLETIYEQTGKPPKAYEWRFGGLNATFAGP